VIVLKPVRRVLVAAVVLACGVSWAGVTQAAGVLISPVILEISSPRKAIAVTVKNDGDASITFQTDTASWQQIDGLDRFEPTDELIVVPSIVVVPAHSSQIVRLMLRSTAPSPKERTYRLSLENITEEKDSANRPASVLFKFSHNLPIMVAPSGEVTQAVRWKPCRSEGATPRNEACVRLLNAGNRRIKIKALTVSGEGWQQALVLKDAQNVLAGAQREWHIPLVSGQIGVLRAVQVDTAQGEMLQAGNGEF
jgi:fimbrial chaperone protein